MRLFIFHFKRQDEDICEHSKSEVTPKPHNSSSLITQKEAEAIVVNVKEATLAMSEEPTAETQKATSAKKQKRSQPS